MSVAAARPGYDWQVVRRAEAADVGAPIQFGPRAADFVSRMEPIPDLGVLSAPDLILVGPHGLVLTPAGELLSGASFWHGYPEGLTRTPATPVRRVRGTLVSLMSDFATANYGHFLMDSLPRLSLLESAGVSLADADHIYCGVPHPRVAHLLDELGVPRERRIYAQRGEAIRADRVIVTSFPGGRRNYPPWVPDFLRERLGVATGAATRRLYIPRAHRRRILNIDDLMPILVEYGFEVFEPTGPEDSRRAFAEASVVVGGHGAGLAGVAFCHPGAAVLELLPDSHVMPFYATLSLAARLRYGYLLGEGVPVAGAVARSTWDFRVDPTLFRSAMEATIARAPQ